MTLCVPRARCEASARVQGLAAAADPTGVPPRAGAPAPADGHQTAAQQTPGVGAAAETHAAAAAKGGCGAASGAIFAACSC